MSSSEGIVIEDHGSRRRVRTRISRANLIPKYTALLVTPGTIASH